VPTLSSSFVRRYLLSFFSASFMSITVRRVLLVLSILLLLIFAAGLVFAKFWLDPFLKQKLTDATARSEIYALKIDRLHVNIFTGSAEADGIQLTTDSVRWEAQRLQRPDSIPLNIDLQISHLFIYNLGWLNFWRTKNLRLNEIEIFDPQLKLITAQDTILEKQPETDTLTKGFLERLPLLLAPHAKTLSIGAITVHNGKVSFRARRLQQSTYQQADSIGCTLSNINIRADDTLGSGRALYAHNISLALHNYEWYPAGDIYAYRIKSVTLLEASQTIKLEECSMLPTISDKEYMQRLTFRKPRLKLRVAEIDVQKLDLFRALHKQEWTMESIIIEQFNLNLFQNKDLPLKPGKRMPNESFRAIKSYINIDTILIRNSYILYTEIMDDGKGLLEFDRANGVILNVTNDTLKMSDATPARIDARAELMGAGTLDVSVRLPLLAQTFRCSYTANLGKIDMTYLNRLLTDKDNLRIESGASEKILLQARVQNGLAQGTIEATYSDLKISLLRDKDKSKKKLMSAVANLIIRGNNEKDLLTQPFKVGTVNYQRAPIDGFIRFLWRSAQSGLMETLLPVKVKMKGK